MTSYFEKNIGILNRKYCYTARKFCNQLKEGSNLNATVENTALSQKKSAIVSRHWG